MRETARGLLLSVVLILIAFVAFTYWSGSAYWRYPAAEHPAGAVGTTGTIDTKTVRERGAEVGAKVAEAAAKVGQTVDEAELTSKIKAKMVLDDSVKARAIDVTTNGSTVTLSGIVQTKAEHDRAVALARETAGVTKVVDRLQIAR
jgi:hyperosmotically inducible periplasmic protein